MKIKPAGLQQPTQHLGTAPIEAAKPGDIIVIDNGGKLEFSCWGGLLALSAKLKGLSGVVIDGASRDIDEARDLEFPVCARGAVPMTARGRVMQESYNQEIQSRRSAMPSGGPRHRRRQRRGDYRQGKRTRSRRGCGSDLSRKNRKWPTVSAKALPGLEMLEKLGYEQMLKK